VNFTEIEEHMKLAHEEFSTINSLRKSDASHFEKQRLQAVGFFCPKHRGM